VRAAERGQEVVKGHLVGEVRNGEATGGSHVFRPKQIFGSGPQIKQVPGCDARRIVVVIFGPFLRNDQPGRAVIRGCAVRVRISGFAEACAARPVKMWFWSRLAAYSAKER
jgi:hypothetical protein